MDITSVDVKANGTNELLFLFASCGFMRNTRYVGLGLLRCLGGVIDTPLTFSSNIPPVGEAAFDHFHCVEDDASSPEIYHLCKLERWLRNLFRLTYMDLYLNFLSHRG
jgi:hypothetical protein